MEYKRVALLLVILALLMAGVLATLGDKTILRAQYRHYSQLVRQADQLYKGKQYQQAATTYRQALIIDPRDQKIWAKYTASTRLMALQQAAGPRPSSPLSEASGSPTGATTPTIPVDGGMIIEEDEGC